MKGKIHKDVGVCVYGFLNSRTMISYRFFLSQKAMKEQLAVIAPPKQAVSSMLPLVPIKHSENNRISHWVCKLTVGKSSY